LHALVQQRDIDTNGLQWLAQVVAGRREELGFRARGILGSPTRFVDHAFLCHQLRDQHFVLVVVLDRLAHRGAEVAPEEQGEAEHGQHDDTGRVVGRVRFGQHAGD